MVGIEVRPRGLQQRSRPHSLMKDKVKKNRNTDHGSMTQQQQQQQQQQQSSSDKSMGTTLEDFVLTRLPAIRTISAKTDDSPSSVLVDESPLSKRKIKKYCITDREVVKHEHHHHHHHHPMNGDSTAVTATTMSSNNSSSQRTIGTKSVEVEYSKPDYEFSSNSHEDESKSALQSTGFRSAGVGGDENDVDDDCSTDSSAALDAFLDSRLQSLLEDEPAQTIQRSSSTSFGNHTLERGEVLKPERGTQEYPVDLTKYYSAQEPFFEASEQAISANHDDSIQPQPKQSNPRNPSTPTPSQRIPNRIEAGKSKDEIDRRRLSRTATPPPPPPPHYAASNDKNVDPNIMQRTPPTSTDRVGGTSSRKKCTPPTSTKTVSTPPLGGKQPPRASPKLFSTPQRRQTKSSNIPRSADTAFATPLFHPYSRPSLLRRPQQDQQVMNMLNRGLSCYEGSPIENPRTQRSSSYFNPLQGLSPGRYMANSTNDKNPDFDIDDDVSSVDSETFLEMWASKIRADIRREAILELATEAEKAAESGQERFSSSKPWTYRDQFGGDEDTPENSPRAAILRRNASYSEGIAPMNSRPSISSSRLLALRTRLPPKVPIRDLRDVNEVLPDIDIFHKNLRTHFARNHVNESCLIFEEIPKDKSTCTSLGNHRTSQTRDKSSATSASNPQHTKESSTGSFLDSFSFDLLTGAAAAFPNNDKVRTNEHDDDEGIGGFLADHLHSTRKAPKQEVLPGLEDLRLHAAALSSSASEHDLSLPQMTQSHMPRRHSSIGEPKRNVSHIPRALFDDTVSDFSVNESSIVEGMSAMEHTTRTPQGISVNFRNDANKNTNKSGQFVTPAKLRKIRGKDGMSLSDRPNDLAGHIPLPILESTPDTTTPSSGQRHPKYRPSSFVNPSSPVGSDATPPELLLPTLPDTFRDDSAHLSSQKSSNIFPSPSKQQNGSQQSPHSRDSLMNEVSSNDDTQGSNFNRKQTKLMRRAHRRREEGSKRNNDTTSIAVTHDSVVAQAILSEAAKRAVSTGGEDAQLLGSQHEVATPALRDCSCLSLSPAASMEDFGFPEIEDHPTDCAQQDSSSPVPFASAMHMLSKLSPHQRRSTKKKRRAIYVGLRENDDFMQNFLYCGKRITTHPVIESIGAESTRSGPKVCAEPCQDDRCEDGVTALTNTCYATFVLDDPEGPPGTCPSLTSGTKESLFGKKPHEKKAEPETWFDVATEKVDNVLESLVGTTPNNEWNLSFEPPSLRKNELAPNDLSHRRWNMDIAAEYGTMDVASASLSPSNSSVNSHMTASRSASQPSRPSTPVLSLFASQEHKEEHPMNSIRSNHGLTRSRSVESWSAQPAEQKQPQHRKQNSLLAGVPKTGFG